MSLSSPFIHRPVGTTLLTLAIALAGMMSYFLLPVSPLPAVDQPTINVGANLPGASPETMASSVATPLERQFGRIAGVTEMTSSSSLGNTNITLQFDLSRDINACAREVQAAINAAGGTLPANLPSPPTYRKQNPADSPVMVLAITSALYDTAKTYDAAATILQQKISQVEGVGRVDVWGSSLPAVRVEVNPTSLSSIGLALSDVRTALQNANALRPKGSLSAEDYTYSISSTDQLFSAEEYRPLIVAYRKGSPVRLSDVANVIDSVENTRTLGLSNNQPSTSMAVFRQPNANIIETVDALWKLLPTLQASIPPAMKLQVIVDRTTTIRASVQDTQRTLGISVLLVIGVVFLFLRDWRSTFIPSVAVPVSLIGTFGVMYLLGYSLDNLSLMALTISTGFVVDDAIVVVENISRHIEAGMSPKKAALKGAAEIGFTVLSISVSLVAVFIPILLMSGYIGLLFREFAVTLSVAIVVSLVVSLTTTPMMCAVLLRHRPTAQRGRLYRATERVFDGILAAYRWSLAGVLRAPIITLLLTIGLVALTVHLYFAIPTGLFPQQDTGRMNAFIQADQDTSTLTMMRILRQYATIVAKDPAISGFSAFVNNSNSGRMFIALKSLEERGLSADDVIARLRKATAGVAGAQIFFNPNQDLRIGGRGSNAQYQYTLQADNLADLLEWSPKVMAKMKTLPGLLDVNTDQQTGGPQADVVIDRAKAKRLGLDPVSIDNALYDAFGQRQVSTMYRRLNQYHVVMETPMEFADDATAFKDVYVKPSTGGPPVPLHGVITLGRSQTPLSVNHQGLFPAVTISFALAPGVSLSDATAAVQSASAEIGVPSTIVGSFAGTAKAFQESQSTQPLLIVMAIVAVYIVLGILYESLIHPITILSTLPSAGVGALLALMMFGMELDLIATIGIILLVGIVKKNAIMMIDFALSLERGQDMSPRDAIFQACLLRFRPIMMTTMAALLGGLPLAIGMGVGSELRRPLGVAIVGGLIVSQALTLYTTPVIYLYLDRLRFWMTSRCSRRSSPLTKAHGSAVSFKTN